MRYEKKGRCLSAVVSILPYQSSWDAWFLKSAALSLEVLPNLPGIILILLFIL